MRLILAVMLVLATGCTQFAVREYAPDGTVIREVVDTGAPLLSRKENFSIRHQWLDGENVLHEESIVRGVDENASGQVQVTLEMLKMIQTLTEKAALAGGS